MAVAIRGTTPATTIGTGDPTSITLTGARQPQTDDVLVIIHANNFYALSAMPTPTVGGSTTGVTSIVNADNGSNSAHIKSWYKVVASTGDLTVAVDETGPADEEKALAVYVLSGVDTATPIDVSGSAIATGGTTHIAPSVSPTSSDAYLICHANPGGGTASTAYTPPGTMTEQYDSAISGFIITGATEQLASSGATGTRTFTPNTSETNNAEISIAVKTGGAAAAPAGSAYSQAILPGVINPDGRVYLPGVRYDDLTAAAPATSAPAGLASGAGDAPQPASKISPNAGVASGTGTAPQPAVKVSPSAGIATGTGSASPATAAITVTTAAPTAAGSALQPTVTTSADTAPVVQPIVVSAATQTALLRRRQATTAFVDLGGPVDVTGDVSASAGVASAVGSALQPTVSVSGSTNAPAGLASGAGTAFQPVVALGVQAGLASATGSALAPSAKVGPVAGSPTAAGTAPQPTVSISGSTNALAGLASASGSALQPTIAIKANTAAPVAAGSGLTATIRTGKLAIAAVASAIGTAFTALTGIGAKPPAAGALGSAPAPETTAEVIVEPRTLVLFSTRMFGSAGYNANENHLVFLPTSLPRHAPLVVVCHGTAAEASYYYATSERYRPLEELADDGLVVIAGDLGEPSVPDSWGNDRSVAAIDEVITWAASEYGCDTTRVSLIGDSAGGATALNWARANNDQVAGVALRAGVADVDAVYTSGNALLTLLIDNAYGGNWNASKATHDPALNTGELVPIADRIRCYYTSGDDLIPPASTLAFCDDVGCPAIPVGTMTHSDAVAATIQTGELANWLLSLY